MLIDTHCHLDALEFSADRDQVVADAQALGVSGMVIPALHLANFDAVRDCCVRYAHQDFVGAFKCVPAYGIHPLYTQTASPKDLISLRDYIRIELAGAHPPCALGEIGLDYFVAGFDAPRQEYFLLEQLKIARDFDLPVLLHVRRALDPVLKAVRRIGVNKGIVHAFNGSAQQAEAFMRQGFKLGFGGALSYPKSTRIHKLAAQLPLEAIVLETDAPDMPPFWLKGKRNSPQELVRIAASLASIRSLSASAVHQASSLNAQVVLALR